MVERGPAEGARTPLLTLESLRVRTPCGVSFFAGDEAGGKLQSSISGVRGID